MAENTFDVLRALVGRVKCKPGWSFHLEDDEGDLTMVITSHETIDAYNPGRPFPLRHSFPVPVATYNEKSWRRWIFERCRGVENHELGEWFRDGDERPFAPCHAPGEDPYVVHEFRPEVDAATTQRGTVWPMKDRKPQ